MKHKIQTLSVLCFAVILAVVSSQSYLSMQNPGPGVDQLVPAKGFTKKMLSHYFKAIKDTPADTEVYIQEGSQPGGTVLVLGGTHPNEPAAMLSAVLLLENIQTDIGRFIIVPYANKMARTHTYPQDGHPNTFQLTRPNGKKRVFRFGARTTNPIYEWPNPDIYIHPQSGQTMAGIERSNLNRAYPGSPDGCMTERLGHGIVQLIKQEQVDLAFDLHEASPEYPVVNAIVAHERAMELAAMVAMELEEMGIPIRLEPSPAKLRGLSHREWGDNTDALALLMETANPSQGRFRGKTTDQLILDGRDKAYKKAAELGQIYIPYENGDQPIDLRVARHVTAVQKAVALLEFVRKGKAVSITGIPEYKDVLEKGVSAFLADPV